MKIFKRARKLFRKNGWRKYQLRVAGDRRREREAINYQQWIAANQLNVETRENLRREVENFERKPLISILLPVYNVEEKWLRRCIESVLEQIYPHWELCIADDCSPALYIRQVLEEYVARDERIKVVFREKNGHISAASNSALELANGEFAALLDHDDELSSDALFYVAKEIESFPEVDFIYTDEDMIDENAKRYTPKFKPDFSLDFLRSVNYVTHLAVYRTTILREIGGFHLGLEGSQDYDLALRVVERISETRVRHIPRILYHWRAIQGSIALSGDEKPYAHEIARTAIRQHLERTGKPATVEAAIYNLHRVRYQLPESLPKVSLILSDSENSPISGRAILNFIEQIDYANLEILAITTNEENAGELASNTSLSNVKFTVCTQENEAIRLNSAAAKATGEILCFADANLKPVKKDWLTELASFAFQKEIGAVGAKILDADESVLHGGLILGDEEKIVSPAHFGYAATSGDNIGRLQLINNFSAVSISCLATRREAFDRIDGFTAKNFPERFFDADFCLRLREKNLRIVYTPYAELIKTNKKRRLNLEKNPTAVEKQNFIKKWEKTIARDPFYNPNLSKKTADFSIDV